MSLYRNLRNLYHLLKFYRKINWYKTLYFNFKKFPFPVAKKLPVYFYGKVKFTHILGEVIIDTPIKRGMIGFGQPFEKMTKAMGIAEIFLAGKIVFNGHAQFGKDYFIYVGKDAYCEIGHLSGFGSSGKLICTQKIVLGNLSRIGYESQIIDTNSHQMIDTITGKKFPMSGEIQLGNYNFVGNRTSIMFDTQTPDYCSIASNSLCNKDYRSFGNNILIGGVPAKLLKENISRDWEGEREMLEENLIIRY